MMQALIWLNHLILLKDLQIRKDFILHSNPSSMTKLFINSNKRNVIFATGHTNNASSSGDHRVTRQNCCFRVAWPSGLTWPMTCKWQWKDVSPLGKALRTAGNDPRYSVPLWAVIELLLLWFPRSWMNSLPTLYWTHSRIEKYTLQLLRLRVTCYWSMTRSIMTGTLGSLWDDG